MEKIVRVGDKDITFKATAYTPTLYRSAFPDHDIFRDFAKMGEVSGDTDDEILKSIDFSVFERIAYVMSGAVKEHITFEDWLESFEMMDIVTILPEITELWDKNMATQSINSKNM